MRSGRPKKQAPEILAEERLDRNDLEETCTGIAGEISTELNVTSPMEF
jgi:hypothetical protein